jgi:DNA-binding response OmpR family regulator
MTQASDKKAHILIVEDEPGIAETLCLLLEMEGYRVSIAYDGQQGLEAVQAARPDLVITDYTMPRMSGGQLIHAIRSGADTGNLPIILMSALLPDAERLAARPDLYVKKPFDIDRMLALVAQLL